MFKPIYPPKAEYRCPSCDNPFLGSLPNPYRYRYGYKFFSFGTNYTDGSQLWPLSDVFSCFFSSLTKGSALK